MPVTLTIKHVPDDLAEKLRQRAASRHRSLQGELLVMLNEALADVPAAGEPKSLYAVKRPRKEPPAHGARLTLAELWARSRRLGSRSASESAAIVRSLRDERHRR